MKYGQACIAVKKWIEKHKMKYKLKWNEMNRNEFRNMKWSMHCSNGMNWDIMKHAIAVMKWIGIF